MRELPDGFAPRRSQNGMQREIHEDHYRLVPAPKRWEHAMADRSSNILTHLADRRHAVRVLGAASTDVLSALGLGGVTGEARGRGGPGESKEKSHRNQPTQRARHMDDAKRPADRGDKSAEPVGDASATARMQNASVAAKGTKRRSTTKRVEGPTSEPLGGAGSGLVFSNASCPGGARKYLSGGYAIEGTPEQLVNLVVAEAGPDGTGRFVVVLRRASGSDSTAGAKVRAIAICKA
jgi:hypothetical protein